MSHVDEGTLHAILDGALDALSDAGELPGGATAADVTEHLRTCADCQARLEAERSIRASAGVVLHDARLPDVDVPPFAGVPVAERARRGRWIPLGWAASILLAVGAGWWGSAAWRAPGPSFDGVAHEAASSAQPESEQAPAPLEAIDDGRDTPMNSARTEAADAGTRRPADVVATRATPEAMDRQTVSADARAARVDPVTGSVGVAPTAAADTPIGAAAADAGQAMRRTERAADPVPAPAPPPAMSLAAPGQLAGVDSIAERLRLAGANPAELRAVDVVRRAPAGALFSFRSGEPFMLSDSTFAMPSSSALKQMLAAVIARPAAFDTTLAREQSGRMAFTAASAEDRRRIEQQIYSVENASPPSIALARDGGATTVRLRQTLQSGEPIELITWRAEPAASLDGADMAREAAVNTGLPRGESRSGVAARAASATAAAPTPPPAAAAPQTMDGAAERIELTTLPAVRRLSDGRNEIVLRDESSSVWIALRADLGAEELRDLAMRLRRLPPR